MRRIHILSVVVFLLPAAAGAQFIIVTRTGAQIPAASAPVIEKQVMRFRSTGGTPLVMHVSNLDVEATERINGVDLPIEVKRVEEVMTGEARIGRTVPMSQRATPAETITNADLKNLRAGRSLYVEAGSALPQVGATPQIQERNAEAPPLNQGEWETRARAIRNRQRELTRRRDALRNEVSRLQRSMLGHDASETQRLGNELDKVQSDLQGVESELGQLQTQWEDLQQEAQRQGVPDSWLR